jgi:hypothetical protein
VKALANLDQKVTTAAGIGGGAVSWVLGNLEVLTELVSFLGAVCGALVAFVSLCLKLSEWRRRRRERVAPIEEPPDVDDRIPLP